MFELLAPDAIVDSPLKVVGAFHRDHAFLAFATVGALVVSFTCCVFFTLATFLFWH